MLEVERIRNMAGTRSQTQIGELIAALRPYQPERVYLFGSTARGEEDELSDLDLVVIKRTALPFFDRLMEVARLLPEGTGGIDVLVYTPEEFLRMQQDGNAFAELIVEEARLIYGGEEKG
jgi:predicted nucleotidyltransferase